MLTPPQQKQIGFPFLDQLPGQPQALFQIHLSNVDQSITRHVDGRLSLFKTRNSYAQFHNNLMKHIKQAQKAYSNAV